MFEKYSDIMLGTCLRYTKDIEEAKDIMHDGFIKIFLNINKFKGESSLTTWMTRVMINSAVSQIRKNKLESRNYFIEPTDIGIEYEDKEIDINDVDMIRISKEEVLEMVRSLPDKYRAIINMYAIDGLSHKEISAELGISTGTSRSLLSRARNILCSCLKEKQNLINAF